MLKIRLRRMGSRHRPFYRVVVSDSRRTPRAPALEEVGYYDPRKTPATLSINVERVDYWMSNGALPSDTVQQLVAKARTEPTADSAAEPAAEAETTTEDAVVEAAAAAETAEADEAGAEKASADDAGTEDASASEEATEAEATEAVAETGGKTEGEPESA